MQRALLARGTSQEAKEFRRTVYDARNDQHITLTDREARFFVDAYYAMQGNRLRAEAQNRKKSGRGGQI